MSVESIKTEDFNRNSLMVNNELYRQLEQVNPFVDMIENDFITMNEWNQSEYADRERIGGEKLTPEQMERLEKAGLSKAQIKEITYNEKEDVYELKTVNDELDGKEHKETGVKYEKKTVEVDGMRIRGVFPKFQSKFDAQLPGDKRLASDAVQKGECNKQLKEAIQKNPELKKQFTEKQLQQIDDGKTPSNYVWHHNEEPGKMQLVDAKTHSSAKHTGGKAIWNKGGEGR